jgi:ABC-2 type transport system ATP-binding protein
MSIMAPNGSLTAMRTGVSDTANGIECEDLVVRYGNLRAVDGLSFTVQKGSVLALLGPNGAGKTSTVETLEGYRRPSQGTVRVLGLDPVTDRRTLVPRIGVMLQRGGVYPTMPAGRVLGLFARYFEDPEDPATLLELVGLRAVARTPWRRLSGGEQQRLSLALALVGKPEVLFLDEPTAGVDPEGRLAIRRVIANLREHGACILLTTHELPEAERLADEVIIVNHGRAVARGTVAELARAGGEKEGIRFAAPPGIDRDSLAVTLGVNTTQVLEEEPGEYRIQGAATPERVAALAGWLAREGLPLGDLRTGRHSLEETYLAVTGEPGTLEEADGQ